jgi:hypothetical protein
MLTWTDCISFNPDVMGRLKLVFEAEEWDGRWVF